MSSERYRFSHDRPPDTNSLSFVNERLRFMNAQGRIGWMLRTFDLKRTVLTTGGGETSLILPTLASQSLKKTGRQARLTIVFVDTLLHGKSTLDFVQKMSERGEEEGYDVLTYKPLLTLDDVAREYPEWEEFGSDHFKKAKFLLKIEPLKRAFQELGAQCWASGPMRWETLERTNMPIVDRRDDGLIMVHPIADWTKNKADKFIKEYNLPSNPEHKDFFKGPDQSMECGIHLQK